MNHYWEKALTYQTYRQMIDALVAEGRTTGETQSAELLNYTKLNIQRMNRIDKTATILPALQERLSTLPAQRWLVLTEGWCGDAAQNIPFLVKLADLAPDVEIKFLLRDENLALMDLYLTNGGRSIPKIIAYEAPTPDQTAWKELFNWGPRPANAQDFVLNLKKENMPFEELAEKLHKWYAENKGVDLQNEFLKFLGY